MNKTVKGANRPSGGLDTSKKVVVRFDEIKFSLKLLNLQVIFNYTNGASGTNVVSTAVT